MKFLIVILILASPVLKGQTLVFKSDRIYRSYIKNYQTKTQEIIDEIVLGKDVTIFVDTVFNKYTIRFTDADNKQTQMVLKQVSNYFGAAAAKDTTRKDRNLLRLYYVEMQGSESLTFLLIDYITLFADLDILALKNDEAPFSEAGNKNMVYRIKNIKPVTQ